LEDEGGVERAVWNDAWSLRERWDAAEPPRALARRDSRRDDAGDWSREEEEEAKMNEDDALAECGGGGDWTYLGLDELGGAAFSYQP
jgi:hypothetical protein